MRLMKICRLVIVNYLMYVKKVDCLILGLKVFLRILAFWLFLESLENLNALILECRLEI